MRSLALIVLAAFLLLTCNNSDRQNIDSYPLQLMMGICIYDDAPVLEEASPASELITSLFIGDEIRYLGESQKTMNQEFLKIELAEGTQAWVNAQAVLLNAKSAAALKETAIYATPSTDAQPQNFLQPAEFIVAIDDQYDWYQIVGANRSKQGWVRKAAISFDEDDVFIASIAHLDLLDENCKIRKAELPYFLKSIPNPNSQLALYLKDELENEVSRTIEESIMEYEMNYYTELLTREE